MSYHDESSESVIARVLKLLESEFQHIRRERAALENIRATITQSTHIPTQKIKLDVGGALFATTIATLTKIPDCYFGTTFSGRWEIEIDSDGTFFIDRDPTTFPHVLNFLREYPNPTLQPLTLSPAELNRLTEEAKFYAIQPLIDMLATPNTGAGAVAGAGAGGFIVARGKVEEEEDLAEDLFDLFGLEDN